MKQLFILFLLFFITDSLASGIASNTASAPCTNTTLETYSGNSNLAADWQPNEIKLRWYNNNTLMDVQASANTCTYDDTLTIPQTAPTRTGYTFAGWTVRPEIDFAATIPTNEMGADRWGIGMVGGKDYCWYGNSFNIACNSDENYNELQRYEWKVGFTHGDLYGMAGCSATFDGRGKTGNPTLGTGRHCWCKATGYKAKNTSIIRSSLHDLFWVYSFDYGTDTICAERCALRCTYEMANEEGMFAAFLIALFTPANN